MKKTFKFLYRIKKETKLKELGNNTFQAPKSRGTILVINNAPV